MQTLTVGQLLNNSQSFQFRSRFGIKSTLTDVIVILYRVIITSTRNAAKSAK